MLFLDERAEAFAEAMHATAGGADAPERGRPKRWISHRNQAVVQTKVQRASIWRQSTRAAAERIDREIRAARQTKTVRRTIA
eukprot:856422-Pyramimonas_sp.AAC.1